MINYIETNASAITDYCITMNYLVNGTAGGITNSASTGTTTYFRVTRIG